MRRDEQLEFADQPGVPPEGELGLEQVDLGREAELGEPPDLVSCGPVKLDVGKRRAAPEIERGAPQLHGALERRVPGIRSQALEPQEIEVVTFELDAVTRSDREDGVGAELPAEGMHVTLDELRGGLRRPLAPELVDETIGGDDLVGVEQENGEKRALLGASEPDRSPVEPHLDGAEDPEFHRPRKALRQGDCQVSARSRGQSLANERRGGRSAERRRKCGCDAGSRYRDARWSSASRPRASRTPRPPTRRASRPTATA